MNFAAGALCAVACGSVAWAQPHDVRVRLKRGLKVVAVGGVGLSVAPPARLKPVALPGPAPVRALIRAPERGRWLVELGEAEAIELRAERLVVRGERVRLGADAAPFDLELHARADGGIDVIAHLELEDYLTGVLPAEMPLAWPIEALKAQAVAARSFALTRARERTRRHFDVDSTITDQVYKFALVQGAHPALGQKLRRALFETRGEVLVDARGQVVKAFYSADCGCTTEDPRYVWGRLDGFESVRDPTCAHRRPQRWGARFSRVEVERRLDAGLKLSAGHHLTGLDVGARTPSGRVASVVALFERGDHVARVGMNVNEFRRVIGYRRIRSAEFDLDWRGDELAVTGVGLGHGVGMCQTGAKAMALEGATYQKILKHYYPKATLKTPQAT